MTSLGGKLKQWSSLLTLTPLMLGPGCIVAPFFPKETYRIMQSWSRSLRKTIDLEVNVIDRNPPRFKVDSTTGTLYVHLNQQTLLSMVLYLAAFPFHKLVMNIEFALLPFIGWCPSLMGGTPIIRQFPSSAKRSLETVVNELAKGESYCISIEGKRCGEDGKLSPFKKGPIVLALKSQCDIVPFLTFGEFLVWPYGKWSIIPGGKVDVLLLPRISTKGLTFENDRNELLQRLRNMAEIEITTWEEKNRAYIDARRITMLK